MHLFTIVVAARQRLSGFTKKETQSSTHEVFQSFAGGTVASLSTASNAVSRSKSRMPFTTASAMSESAWVPTCKQLVEPDVNVPFRLSYHDICLCVGLSSSPVRFCYVANSPTMFFHIGSHPPCPNDERPSPDGRHEDLPLDNPAAC